MTAEPIPSPEDDDALTWSWFREQLQARLDRDRPARYDTSDQSWMEPAIGWGRAHFPADDATIIRRVARSEAIALEKEANRKANALLKRYATGRAPLFWNDIGALPFTLDKKTGARCRFDAALPADIENRAAMVRSDAKDRYFSELAVANALEFIAAEARRRGVDRVYLIGDLPLREDGRIDDLDWDDESEEDDV